MNFKIDLPLWRILYIWSLTDFSGGLVKNPSPDSRSCFCVSDLVVLFSFSKFSNFRLLLPNPFGLRILETLSIFDAWLPERTDPWRRFREPVLRTLPDLALRVALLFSGCSESRKMIFEMRIRISVSFLEFWEDR